MPDLVISLTANQAQRLGAALGASTIADAVVAVKKILKEEVKKYEAREASNAAFDSARDKVDADFGGF